MKPTNVKKYDWLDVVLVLMHIGREQILSRHHLKKELNIGEGSLKSILQDLEGKKLIRKTLKGSLLTQKGSDKFEQIMKRVSFPRKIDTDVFKWHSFPVQGMILKKASKEKLNVLYYARDHAIREGCQAAMVLVKKKFLCIPELEEFHYNELEEEFEIKENQVLALAASDDVRTSQKGILSVCDALNKELHTLFKEISE